MWVMRFVPTRRMSLSCVTSPCPYRARLLVSLAATRSWRGLRKPPQAVTTCPAAFNSKIPLSRILSAAFISRSISPVPQDGHDHSRTDNGISSTLWPQLLHVLELANHWSNLTKCFPCSFALYFSFTTKPCYEASAPARIGRGFTAFLLNTMCKAPKNFIIHNGKSPKMWIKHKVIIVQTLLNISDELFGKYLRLAEKIENLKVKLEGNELIILEKNKQIESLQQKIAMLEEKKCKTKLCRTS